MNNKLYHWLLFIALSFIWGSSFILMKEGLNGLSPFQVASIRIITSGLVLLPIAIRYFNKIPGNKLLFIFLSGTLGSLLPAYLFCIAEQVIDSALAGVLNSLTPIFVIICGALFFQSKTPLNKIIGIVIAFTGSALLCLAQPGFGQHNNFAYTSLIIMATLLYGYNVNMVHRHLADIPSLHIAAIALSLNAIPAFAVLWFTGYFNHNNLSSTILWPTIFSCILGVFGTAIATVLFYVLLKRAGAVFASMVTYGIPIVAIFWGIIYGEKVGWLDALSLLIILSGVYIANKKMPSFKISSINK